jgi:hypothetical protein
MRSSVGLMVVLGLTGCGTFVTVTPLDPRPTMTAGPPSLVDVYSSGPPTRAHHDVALLEVEQTHGLNEQGTPLMIRRLREQAAAMGCDGIVLGGFRERDGAPTGSSWALVDPGSTTLHATCIVYRDEEVGSFTPPSGAAARAAPGEPTFATRQRIDREEPR